MQYANVSFLGKKECDVKLIRGITCVFVIYIISSKK
jgi:hypothetical protein